MDPVQAIVEKGGGVYCGIQHAVSGPDLVLFNSPRTGSTLAVELSHLTPAAVARRIAESDAEFDVN
jgi:hypothetical protein